MLRHMKVLNFPNLVLLLTWWLFAMYNACRFNYSPMIPMIKDDLNILNTQAGWLMACFFISYTIFQIPSGYLGDRFGPRKALSWGAVISIAGTMEYLIAAYVSAVYVGGSPNFLM